MSSSAGRAEPGKVEQDWRDRGFSCAVQSSEPGQEWKDYAQDADVILMILAGEVEVELAGETRRLAPGTEFVIPTGACPTFRTTGESRAAWLRGYGREYACTD